MLRLQQVFEILTIWKQKLLFSESIAMRIWPFIWCVCLSWYMRTLQCRSRDFVEFLQQYFMFKLEVNQPSVKLSPHLFCDLTCTEIEESKEWCEKDLCFGLCTSLNLLETRENLAQSLFWLWMDVSHSRGLCNVDVKYEWYLLLDKGVCFFTSQAPNSGDSARSLLLDEFGLSILHL